MRTPEKTYLSDKEADHLAVWVSDASGKVTDMINRYPGHPEMVDAFEIMNAAKKELARAYRFKKSANEQRNLSFEADSDDEALEMLEAGSKIAMRVLWSVFQIDRLHVKFDALTEESERFAAERIRQRFADEMDRARRV